MDSAMLGNDTRTCFGARFSCEKRHNQDMRKLLRFVGERHTLPVGAILLASFPALLCSQQAEQGAPAGRGGRGPAATYWAAKTKGGVYVPPNKPLVKLADLKARHAGETNWTEIVVKDPENQAEYNSAAPGAKFQPRMHPDTGALFVVVAGDIHFEIENLQPIEATRGSIINILRTTIYSFEIKGDKPALWVEIKPLNYQTVFPGDGPPPPAPTGTEMVKVSFGRTKAVYSPPNIPHWNLFEAAKSGAPNTYRALQDHLFANPIYGYADPNDPANPNRGNPGAGGRGGRGGADSGPFNPNSVFGHMHPGPAEWWIVQSGQVVGRFENTGEFVGSEGDILYATPMTWHQMGFQGPGLSCRLALGAYDFINMNNTADQAQANPALAQTVRPFVEKYCLKCHGGTAATPGAPVPLLPMLSARDTFLLRRREWETLS
jgi:quercetin dioxygenase-like cupin family protein